MRKLIVLKLHHGNFSEGFNVTVEMGEEGSQPDINDSGKLPPAPKLCELYQDWQDTYRSLDGNRIVAITQPKNFNLDLLKKKCQQKADKLCRTFNDWLQADSFRRIKEKCLEHVTPEDEVRVIICCEDIQVRKLPWHLWNLWQDYKQVEIGCSRLSSQRTPRVYRQNIRILVVLGNSVGIEVERDKEALEDYCANANASLVLLVEPTRQQLNKQLWDKQGWDILFFSGHSQTQENQGRIFLNRTDSLTLPELRHGLDIAIQQGLQIAFFNSCDGLGLAAELESWHIPQVIVMREPVPDRVAQEFLKYFLEEFITHSTSFYQAVGIARKKLQGWENEYPCASWLPVIVQNLLETPPTWQSLGAIYQCPYRGLEAFRTEDAPNFFGREKFVEQLVNAVQQQPLVAVVGASGSGKSSVVFAGLIPALQQQQNCNWRVISFRPGNNPFESLAVALTSFFDGNNQEEQRNLNQFRLELELRNSNRTLERIIAQLYTPNSRTVLIADQFEELYTLCSNTKEQQIFLDNLLNAVEHEPDFTLVLTLRADFYNYALSYRRFADALQHAVYNLGPMTQGELRDAIARPATSKQVQLEPGLTERLIDTVSRSASHLPLLEFVLSQLWQQQREGCLTYQAYKQIGGLEQALANYAESIYAQLDESERQQAQRVFLQLIQPQAGTADVRRLATREEVGGENWELVMRLAAARLVVINCESTTGVETVEIVHEALMSNWKRLRQWLQLHGEFRRWQEQLRSSLEQWKNSGKDEGALLRGKPLAVAVDWLHRRWEQLSPAERGFIESSLKLQQREQKQKERIRRRTILGLLAGLLVTLILVVVSGWQWQQAEFERQQAQINEFQAVNTSAQVLFDAHHQLEALKQILTAVRQQKPSNEVAAETQISSLATLRDIVYQIREHNELTGHENIVSTVSFSPDGQAIASGSYDGTIKIWSKDGRLLQSLPAAQDAIMSVSFSPNGQFLASAGFDNKVRLWRRNRANLFVTHPYLSISEPERVMACAFSPDGKIIATANKNGKVKLWNLGGKLLKTFQAHQSLIWSLSFSPDGIATASADKTVKLWSREGNLLKTFSGHENEVLSVSFSPDRKILASGSKDQTIKLWQLDGKLLKTFTGHSAPVLGLAFSPDSRLIASASADHTVKIWSLDQEKELETLSGHSDRVNEVSFSPDGKVLASASADQTVRLWSITGIEPTMLQGTSLSFSPSGEMLALGSKEGNITLWQRNSKIGRNFSGGNQEISQVSFSPDGKTLATVDDGNYLKFWSLDGKPLHSWQDITAVSFSPDGKIIATADTANTVKLRNLEGKLLHTLLGHHAKISSMSFSPDGILATGSEDKTVKLWDQQGNLLHTLLGHQQSVSAVSFNSDGEILATASYDNTVKLWNSDGKLLATLQHPASIYHVSFSPNLQVLVTASGDHMLYLWNVNGEQLHAFSGHEGEVLDVSFSPDGKAIASADIKNQVILWDLDEDNLQKQSCNWLRDYLATHKNLEQSKQAICQGINNLVE